MKVVAIIATVVVIIVVLYLLYRFAVKLLSMRASDPDRSLSRRQKRDLAYRRRQHELDQRINRDLDDQIYGPHLPDTHQEDGSS